MQQVHTMRGPVNARNLGVTLMHEHIFVLDTDVVQNYPADWGVEETRVADAIKRLSELKACGVDTIVDLTVVGLGRYIPRVAGWPRRPTSTSSLRPASTPSTTCPCTFTISDRDRSSAATRP